MYNFIINNSAIAQTTFSKLILTVGTHCQRQLHKCRSFLSFFIEEINKSKEKNV